MKKHTQHLGALALLAGLAASAQAQVGTYLNDTFADNDRTTQNLTSSSAYYFAQANMPGVNTTGSNITIAPQIATTASGYTFLTYFTPSGTPAALTVGQTITLKFDLNPQALVVGDTGRNQWRFALLNSGGTRISADGAAIGNATTPGYGINFNNTGSVLIPNGLSLIGFSRNSNSSAPISVGTAAAHPNNPYFSAVDTGAAASSFIGAGFANTFTFSLTKVSATQNDFFISILNGQTSTTQTWSFSDTASVGSTAFDTFAFQTFGLTTNPSNNALGISQVFDNVSVTVIPEPSAYAVLAGLATLGLVIYRRRKAA